MRTRILVSAAVALLVSTAARAQTIYVDTSADVTDFGGAQQVVDLPGPDGRVSLAEAGLASDNTPGVQTIGFRVPPSEWTMQWLYPGRVVLQPFLGFRVFEPVILDGTTQTAFSGETNPEGGAEVVIWASTYVVDTTGSLVRGFDNSSLYVSGGSANVLQGNTESNIEVYDSPFTIVGGTGPGEGNTCGTIKLDRTNDCVVVGNTTTRVRVLGWFGGAQPATNNRIGGPTLAERNYITGYGTIDGEGCPGGTTVQIFDSIGTLVENNWIGTTPDGLAQGSLASVVGVGLEGENHDVTIRGNRIAGILGHGQWPHCPNLLFGSAVEIYGTGGGVRVLGNVIGLDANDQPLLGSVTGVSTVNYYLGPVQDVVIGGTGAGEANEIAGHLQSGVRVANTYSGMRITGNSIHDNGALGIDLIPAGFQVGVTPNDPLDADAGGNGLQNFPVLQSAAIAGGQVRVVGTLGTSASASVTLEFFASPACDGSGFGEGRQFLGAATVATDAGGNASFDIVLPAAVAPGWFVTATATRDADGSTSEFSACTPVGASAGSALCFGDGSSGACPCGNPGLAGRGCDNSEATGGAALAASGTASLSADTLVLATSHQTANGTTIVMQGDAALGAPTPFGQGLRCVGGTLVRLYLKIPGGAGGVTAPAAGDPSVSVRSAALGDPITPATHRYYMAYYRDPVVLGGCPAASTFNATHALDVLWAP